MGRGICCWLCGDSSVWRLIRRMVIRSARNYLVGDRPTTISNKTGELMKNKKKIWAAVIGVVCGAELVIAAIIGGAGLSAFFGLEGLLVGAIVVSLAASYFFARRRRQHITR